MSLCLHCGAEPIEYDGLRELPTPPATPTHVPIPHYRLADLVRHSLTYYGHEIQEEHHGATPDGMRYFAVLSLRSPHTGYTDTVALRNSHDKRFPVGIAFGGRVFCCDNLSLMADRVIKRKHTANLKRELPGLVAEVIEGLAGLRQHQHKSFMRYQVTPLSDEAADHAILNLYREGVVNVQRIPDLVREWEHPTFEDWGVKTAWRLFNAATYALSGRVIENSAATVKLHRVIDSVCEAVN